MPTISIEAGNKTVSDVEVTVVGEGVYRLEEEPALFLAAETEDEISSFPRFGDTVLASRIDSTTVRFEAIHEKGPYQHYEFMLSEETATSATLQEFLSSIVVEGGHWERLMGGMLVIALKHGSSINPNETVALMQSQ